MWKLTDSEWKVLEALWAGGPQHLGQILGALAPETGWSRTTVHTYLTRMAAKGLVSMDQSSPRRYAAIPSRETCAARERRDLVNRVYDGSAGQLVAAFVNNLGDIAGRELSRRVFHTLDNIGRLLTFGIPPAAAMLGYLILFGWGVAFLAEFFRNKNFTAIRTGGVLTINRGLFTLRSHAVAVGQINYLDLRETLFSRLLGLGSVYLHVTGILSDRQDIMPIIPVVTRRRLSDILGELLPEFSPAPNQLTHNRGAVIRFLGDALLALAGVGLAVLLLVRRFPQWRRFTLFTGLMALLPCCWFLMVRLMDYRSAGAARVGDTYTLRYSQGFYLHTVMLPRERIVSVSTRQSLLQLLDDRCDVFVTTYSQGKSRHRLRNLDRQEASRMFGFGPLPPRRGLARLLTGLRRK